MSQWHRIVLLGDSITQYSFDKEGWGTSVASVCQRKCDILNRGFSGYTTASILKYIDNILKENMLQNVAAVTLFLGANDSSLVDENPNQHVPLDQFEANLATIVDRLHALGVALNKIIVIAPPAVDEEAWLKSRIEKGTGTVSDRKNSNTSNYAKACQRVAESKKCRYIDLWSEMMKNKDFSKYLVDGLHLSGEGNSFLGTLLVPHIEDLTEHLPTVLPLWRDLVL